MEIIIFMSWAIWMARNDLIFKGVNPTIQGTVGFFKLLFTQVFHRVKESLKPQMTSWLDHTL